MDRPPTIASQFPLVFSNGARWDEMEARCNGCGFEGGGDDLRGSVTQPFRDVFIVDAVLSCPSCTRQTRAHYRLLSDMSMTGRSPTTGEWARWVPKYSIFVRFKKWLRRLFFPWR